MPGHDGDAQAVEDTISSTFGTLNTMCYSDDGRAIVEWLVQSMDVAVANYEAAKLGAIAMGSYTEVPEGCPCGNDTEFREGKITYNLLQPKPDSLSLCSDMICYFEYSEWETKGYLSEPKKMDNYIL